MSNHSATLFVAIASLICSASAISTGQKLKIWFPKYEYHWIGASESCESELNDYWTDNRSRCWAVCACAADCLLDHTTETIKSNMAAATVILGFMPCVLTMLGPSVVEMSLLSTRHPLLAILLSFASPALNLPHIYDSPASLQDSLSTRTGFSTRKWHTWMEGLPTLGRTAVRLAECALAGGMLANTVHISLYVDHRTVSGWRCSLRYLPLSWALAGGLVHLFGIIAIRFRQKAPPKSSDNSPGSRVKSAIKHVSCLLVVRPDQWKCVVNGQDGIIGETLFSLASLAGIGHIFFGVMVFSSLMFVGVLDTLPIVARYGISAVVCQAIVHLELASMRLDIQKEGMSGNIDSDHWPSRSRE